MLVYEKPGWNGHNESWRRLLGAPEMMNGKANERSARAFNHGLAPNTKERI
jgi:hypothetical protein